jgi:hypothetical protein
VALPKLLAQGTFTMALPIKVQWLGKTHPFEGAHTWQALALACAGLSGRPVSEVFYMDEYGDKIEVRDEAGLQEALRWAQQAARPALVVAGDEEDEDENDTASLGSEGWVELPGRSATASLGSDGWLEVPGRTATASLGSNGCLYVADHSATASLGSNERVDVPGRSKNTTPTSSTAESSDEERSKSPGGLVGNTDKALLESTTCSTSTSETEDDSDGEFFDNFELVPMSSTLRRHIPMDRHNFQPLLSSTNSPRHSNVLDHLDNNALPKLIPSKGASRMDSKSGKSVSVSSPNEASLRLADKVPNGGPEEEEEEVAVLLRLAADDKALASGAFSLANPRVQAAVTEAAQAELKQHPGRCL